MKLSPQQIATDLSVFADIGTDAPAVGTIKEGHSIRFVRNGDASTLIVNDLNDVIIEQIGDASIKHTNFKSLLASDRFGNVRDWAAKQTAYIASELREVGSLIPISGLLNDAVTLVDIEAIDDRLVETQAEDSTRLLLIDGPAGIGKTQYILSLVARRVLQYAMHRRPLILHVQSRGRTLSYLYDLIAFSLQRLRLDVTFDQVPILAKYGLVTIAIDGFDELADPDGYSRAWSQVSDLVHILRGSGSLILAGRETFIGKDRIVSDISSLRLEVDEINVLTLQPPTKGVAINWLRGEGWNEEQLNGIDDFLAPSSLALRPFFLKTLSKPEVAGRIASTTSTSILSILMEAMIDREIGKFGDAIDRELTADERRAYLRAFIGEAARDMAESASSSISDATLAWLVDVALPKDISEEATRILKGRSQSIAFFANDDRKGYRRFFHDKFYEYFLAITIIDMVIKRETGRVLSRTILGSSFFETFGDVISSGTSPSTVKVLLETALRLIDEYPPVDRTRKNLASLVIAALSVADVTGSFVVGDVDVDEARFSGTAADAKLQGVVINQFDIRGGNIAAVHFEKCTILTLIADVGTLVGDSFPVPVRIRDVGSSGVTISSPDEVKTWLSQHLETPPQPEQGLIPEDLREHPVIKLLHKACRLRQYWLRHGDDRYGSRVLEDANWPLVEEVLDAHGLLRVEVRQASGTDARFLHVRRGDVILAEEGSNPDVRGMYLDLVQALRSEG